MSVVMVLVHDYCCLCFTFDLVNLVHTSFEDDVEDLFSILLKEARLVKGVGGIWNEGNGRWLVSDSSGKERGRVLLC